MSRLGCIVILLALYEISKGKITEFFTQYLAELCISNKIKEDLVYLLASYCRVRCTQKFGGGWMYKKIPPH